MKFLAVLIIVSITNCILADFKYYEGKNKYVDNIVSYPGKITNGYSLNAMKFMKNLYKKVHSGRIKLPKNVNTVRSLWPIEVKSQPSFRIYNVSLPKSEEIIKAIVSIKAPKHSRYPVRILIDVVPEHGNDFPPGINVPLKDVSSVNIKRLLDYDQNTSTLLTLKVQKLKMGYWTEFQMRKIPVIVIFSWENTPLRLNDIIKLPLSSDYHTSKVRRKRESNTIHSNYIFKDLIDKPTPQQVLKKSKIHSAISKRQKYLKKKLNQRKLKKQKKRKKSSRKRKQKKNGIIPYPKDYPKAFKGLSKGFKKRKKIIPQTFISASMNRVSNDLNSIREGFVESSSICKLQDLYVDFKDIGWDFVVAPMGFNPNYCSGGCSNPLPRTEAGANYAIIRSIMRQIGDWPNLSPSYCVSDKMSSLTLLIQTKDGRIELKNYPDMQAESCSCQ